MQRKSIGIYPKWDEYARRAGPWRRFRAKILPVHVYKPLVAEFHLAMLRLRTGGLAAKYEGSKDLLINVGCGANGLPGWVNVDGYPSKNVNCVCDCRKKLPFPDGSARGIFSEHFFEHLDYTEEVPLFLEECLRVLRPGGVIRLVVPDAGKYLRAYCAEGWTELAQLRGLDGERTDPWMQCAYHTKMELINTVFRQGAEHKWAYDAETLCFLLSYFGFADPKPWGYRESQLPELAIDREVRKPESLYVEARKGS